MRRIYFEEEQRWNLPGARIILMAVALGTAVVCVYLIYWIEFNGETYGNPVDTNRGMIFTAGGCSLTCWIIYFMLTLSRLYIKITDNGVFFRFSPYHNKERFISKEEITAFSVRKFNVYREFGGYGLKKIKGKKTWALTVKGNTGLEIIMQNGKKVMLGTQRPDFILTAMEKMSNYSAYR